MSKHDKPGKGHIQTLGGRGYTVATNSSGDIVGLEVRGADLAVPDRSLTADWVRAENMGGTVKMIFGQLKLDNSGLLAALVVQMSYPAIYDTLYREPPVGLPGKKAPTFLDSLKNYRESRPLDCSQPKLSGDWMTERVAIERARLMSIAFMSDDADIRFYRLSPGDFQALKLGRNNDLVYPVVEVTLGTNLLCVLIDEIGAIVQQLGAPPPPAET